jgi:Spy/CpxP family protein refolding chaperone
MRRLLTVAPAAVFLTFALLTPARAADQEMRNLKQGHKQQWRSLKEQERAERNAFARHPQTREARKRFNQDMKAQRRLVRQVQRTETRQLKASRLEAKRVGRASKRSRARSSSAALN